MLSLFFITLLVVPSNGMNYTYNLENLAPDLSKNLTYTFNQSYANLNSCETLCNTLNNCSGFYDIKIGGSNAKICIFSVSSVSNIRSS